MLMSVRDRSLRESDARTFFKFGVRELFAFTTLVAIVMGLVVVAPNSVAGGVILILTFSLPVGLTTVLIYGRGFQRTFCVGALFPTAGIFFSFSWLLGIVLIDGPGPNNIIELTESVGESCRWYAALSWVFAFVLGMFSVSVRILVERRRNE